jgi:hypothetical protein
MKFFKRKDLKDEIRKEVNLIEWENFLSEITEGSYVDACKMSSGLVIGSFKINNITHHLKTIYFNASLIKSPDIDLTIEFIVDISKPFSISIIKIIDIKDQNNNHIVRIKD